jgi:hypothetical protein
MIRFQTGVFLSCRRCAMIAALLVAVAGAPGAIAQTPPAENTVNTASTADTTTTNTTTTDTTTASSDTTNDKPNASASNSAQAIDPGVYGEMFKILFAVFTIAVVLESALALIFNWRLFLLYFDSRGAKTVVSAAAGILVAWSLGLDVIDRLYKAMFPGGNAGLGAFGYVLTGLVLAGGSAGVNNILKALGFRSLRDEEVRLPKPPTKQAWLAVRLNRKSAEGPVQVFLTRDNGGERLIGTITGRRAPTFLQPLRANPMRFPPLAGFAVPSDSLVTVQLRDPTLPAGQDASALWGPYRIGEGAIIDFELTL